MAIEKFLFELPEAVKAKVLKKRKEEGSKAAALEFFNYFYNETDHAYTIVVGYFYERNNRLVEDLERQVVRERESLHQQLKEFTEKQDVEEKDVERCKELLKIIQQYQEFSSANIIGTHIRMP